jgi:hypothetical protein
MPIPVTSFPLLSFQQAAPGIAGAQTGLDMLGKILQQQGQVEQLPYLAPAAKAGVEQKQALTELTEEQARFTPLKYALQAQQLSQVGQRFGPKYQYLAGMRGLPQGVKATYISGQPAGTEAVMSALGKEALQPAPGQSSLVQQLMSNLYPGMQQQAAQQRLTGQVQQPQQQLQAQGQQLPPPPQQLPPQPGAQQPGIFDTTPQKIANIKTSAEMTANQQAAGTVLSNRAGAALGNEKWLQDNQKDYSRMINNTLNYAGLGGKLRLEADRKANRNMAAVRDYELFTGSFNTFVGNNIKLMDRMGATDQQKIEVSDLFQKGFSVLNSNPKLARQYFNATFEMIHNQAKAIMSAAQPIHKGVLQKQQNIGEWKGKYLDDWGQKAQGQRAPAQAPSVGTVRMRLPDGRIGSVDRSKVSALLRAGAVEVK